MKKRIIFKEKFYVGKIKIDEDRLLEYLEGIAYTALGAKNKDFYYCYFKQKDTIFYFIVLSDDDIDGSLFIFFPALFSEGKYFYKKDDEFYIIIRDAENIYIEKSENIEPDYHDIQQIAIKLSQNKSLPSSLYLKWALKKDRNLLLKISFIIFSFSLLTFTIKKIFFPQQKNDTNLIYIKSENKLPNLAIIIKDVSKLVKDKGLVEKVELINDKLQFVIQFENRKDAEEFVKKYGGQYENNKVIYSTNIFIGN